MDQPIEEFLRRWFDAHAVSKAVEAGRLARAELIEAERAAVELAFRRMTTP